MLRSYSHKLHIVLLMLLAFILPVYIHLASWIIALLIINRLFGGKVIYQNENLWQKLSLIAMVMFFFLGLLGLFYSDHLARGIREIQLLLSFVIFPLLFSFTPKLSHQEIKNILIFFMSGCFFASVIDLAFSIYNYFYFKPWIENFFGTMFSRLMHIGYFAWYLNFAIASGLYLLYRYRSELGRLRYIPAILAFFFAIMVILTTSKNQIIALFLMSIMIGVFLILQTKKYILGTAIFVSILVGFFLFIEAFPTASLRFSTAVKNYFSTEINESSEESTVLRKLAWKSTQDIISENVWIGIGTGDLQPALQDIYAREGYSGALKLGINSHNQYLQTLATVGILGGFVMLAMFIFPLIYSLHRRHYLLTLLIFLSALAALTESVFQAQAGVIFFCFFTSLLLFHTEKDFYLK